MHHPMETSSMAEDDGDGFCCRLAETTHALNPRFGWVHRSGAAAFVVHSNRSN